MIAPPFTGKSKAGSLLLLLLLALRNASIFVTAQSPVVILRDENTVDCPEDYNIITSYPACLAALHYLGPGNPETDNDVVTSDSFAEVESNEDFPSGCYFWADDDMYYFNEHPSGSAEKDSFVVCAQNLEPLSTGNVLWIGDSDVDFWKNTAEISPGSHNVAIAGSTCEDILGYMDDMVNAFLPETVVLVCGENDLFDSSAAEAFSRLSRVVDKLNALGTRVIFMGTKDEPDSSSLWSKYAKYDTKVKKLAENLAASSTENVSALTFVDVNAGFKDIGNPDSLYGPDELHLSHEGYALWDEWVTLALDDDSCVIWQSGSCTMNITSTDSST